jgi:hypothetical protein
MGPLRRSREPGNGHEAQLSAKDDGCMGIAMSKFARHLLAVVRCDLACVYKPAVGSRLSKNWNHCSYEIMENKVGPKQLEGKG